MTVSSLHTQTPSPSFLPFLPLSLSLSLSLFLSLRDVGDGVTDFQTPPVDGPCKGEEQEQDEQHPRDVDPFGLLGGMPRSKDKSCSGGSEHHKQHEAQ